MGDRPKYRSRRAVKRQMDLPAHIVTRWTRARIVMVCCGVTVLAMTTLFPILMLELTLSPTGSKSGPISLHSLIDTSLQVEEEYKAKGLQFWNQAAIKIKDALYLQIPADPESHVDKTSDPQNTTRRPKIATGTKNLDNLLNSPDHFDPAAGVKGLEGGDSADIKKQQLARGVSGLPASKTPALIGARPGHVSCDTNVDDVVYWNDPQGDLDENFVSPFATGPDHYLTFEPDQGGWNNIRMSMEIIFVLAAVTGRTLVLPPKAPMYLLGTGKENVRSFGDFYNLDHPHFKKRVRVIEMKEFLEKERYGILNLSDEDYEKLKPVADTCLHEQDSPINCIVLYEYLRDVGVQPEMEAMKHCFIFDLDHFQGREISADLMNRTKRFCTGQRTAVYYGDELHAPQLIHWNAGIHAYRLLNHFYSYFYFSDAKVDNYYKRFVRDFLHYKDDIYCAAGKIVHALNDEAAGKGWSSLHVRRGDLQYKQVKIPAEEWLNNTEEVWQKGEILFIATDERNKTFFDPIKNHYTIRFLEDYWDLAGLGDLESNFLGMVDTIVASNGRAFAGTWFSTFSGYIIRMRGYLGYSMKDSWYGWLPRKYVMQEWRYPEGNIPAREWPLGWTGIDGDEWIEHELVPVLEESYDHDVSKKQTVKVISTGDLEPDHGIEHKPVSRGVAGRPMPETPALIGAKRGHIQCDINVDSLAYWNSPQGIRDAEFRSPFAVEGEEKYISFSTDRGGWNNVRMSMEIIFVIAAVTGRTLVLPPREPLYRLRADKENLFRGFGDFFPLEDKEFSKRVKIITTEEFIRREGGPDGRVPVPPQMRDNVTASAAHCDKRANSKSFCGHIDDYLKEVGHLPETRAEDGCFVFDQDIYKTGNVSVENLSMIAELCGERKRYYFTSDIQNHTLIHFRGGEKEYRLLTHFYNYVHFTDASLANFYRRFVRDFLRYQDPIYCAAGKIVKALQFEAKARGFTLDDEGGGGFSAMHVRRGDLQFKKVKIPAEEWYANTKEIWKPREILYIATDERNKTFFDPIAKHHDVRFLDDYFDLAKLGDLDPNWFGMIDTIVASRGRAFAGTFFSTFTGYINRLRGYHGLSMNDSWYSWLPRKAKMHTWEKVDHFAYAYEWPDGWVGIDADILPNRDVF